MKRRKLERRLRDLGWRFDRHGGNHDPWTDGRRALTVSRHREVDEWIAKGILKGVQRTVSDRFGRE